MTSTATPTAEVSVAEQGPSPLDYSTSSSIQPDRIALVDPDAGEAPRGDFGFATLHRVTHTSPTTGRRLKKPRRIVDAGAEAGTVAFADYSFPAPRWLYIHYFKTRSDRRGQGLGHRVITELLGAHPEIEIVDFGKVMNEAADAVRRRIAAEHPGLTVRYKRWF